MNMKRHLPARLVLFGFMLVALAACNLPDAQGSTIPTITAVPTTTPVPVVPPTPTLPPAKAYLLAPPGSDAALAANVQTLLAEAGKKQGFIVEKVEALQPGDIKGQTRLVVSLNVVDNLTALLTGAPKTQFLVVSPVELGAGANLSVIRLVMESRGFAAGYVGVISAPDWRFGAILPQEDPQKSILENSIRSGSAYFCGVCNSYTEPIKHFPMTWHVPSGSDPAALEAALNEMKQNGVNTVYVGQGVASDQVFQTLAAQNLNLLGDSPPPNNLQARWVATLNYDIAGTIQSMLPELLNGKGGKVLSPTLVLTDINPDLLPQGRQVLVQKTLKTLAAGLVYPFQVPGQ
jgi:hypothetical protein